MRLVALAAAAGCVLSAGLFLPAVAAAQEGGFELTPFAGAYAATSTAVVGTMTGTTQSTPGGPLTSYSYTYRAKQRTAPAVGVRLTAAMTDRVAIEGEVGYAASGVRMSTSGTVPATVPPQARAGDVAGHLLLLNARGVYRWRPERGGLGWHALLGGGVVDGGGDAWAGVLHSMHLSAVFGGGLDWAFGAGSGPALRVDLTDNLYRVGGGSAAATPGVPGRMQSDLLLTAGLTIRWGGD